MEKNLKNNMDNTTEEKKENQFIFISHSHKDIDKVRLVRDAFEAEGYEPILFYLRSLSDKQEINDLIRREIDARLWFCYCDSQNARESCWVNDELKYVKETNKRVFATIDLNSFDKPLKGQKYEKNSISDIERAINSFKIAQNIYLSYAHYDKTIVETIVNELERFGFSVFYDCDLKTDSNLLEQILQNEVSDCGTKIEYGLKTVPNSSFVKQIAYSIKECDYFFTIISSASIRSKFVLDELKYASYNGKIVIPILIDDVQLPNEFEYHLKNDLWIKWNFENAFESVRRLISVLPKK